LDSRVDSSSDCRRKAARWPAAGVSATQGVADFSITDVGNFWLLYTLNTHFPALRHLHDVRRGHPAMLWESMLALVGALSTFATGADARSLPTYEHLRLGEGFAELERRLYELLDGAAVDTAVSLPLKAIRPTLHAVAIDQAKWLEAPQWFLAVSAPLRQQELIPKVLQGCKVGSADVVDTLIGRRCRASNWRTCRHRRLRCR
jgi:type VI secretion system protein ImpJ